MHKHFFFLLLFLFFKMFNPVRSTTTCNLVFSNFVYELFQLGLKFDDAKYADFDKEFDSAKHFILIKILEKSGFSKPLLTQFKLYLKNGHQSVKVLGFKSYTFSTLSGMPQGSHLSPFQFSLFINNIFHVLHYSYLLCFSDDLKIYMKNDLNHFVEYFNMLSLSLNILKYKIIVFYRIRSPIIYLYNLMGSLLLCADNYVIDFGFKFSNSIDPSSHINMIYCSALQFFGFVIRLTNEFTQNKTVNEFYYALMRPIIEYGSVIWNPFPSNGSMQHATVQCRFFGYASFILCVRYPSHDQAPVLKVFGLDSLTEHRRMLGKTFLTDLLSNAVDCPAILSLINRERFKYFCYDIYTRKYTKIIGQRFKKYKINFFEILTILTLEILIIYWFKRFFHFVKYLLYSSFPKYLILVSPSKCPRNVTRSTFPFRWREPKRNYGVRHSVRREDDNVVSCGFASKNYVHRSLLCKLSHCR